jgi:predicted nucleic acid-binding protein
VPVFVDTNVLVYAWDDADPAKQERASDWIDHLWDEGSGRLSFQVMQELYVTLTRKLAPGLNPEETRAYIRDLMAWRPVSIGPLVLEHAWSVEQRYGISFWDALIVAAAGSASCETLLTEDLQHDAVLEGVRVVSPFREPPPGD